MLPRLRHLGSEAFFFFFLDCWYLLLAGAYGTSEERGSHKQITNAGLSLHRLRTWQAGQTTENIYMWSAAY